MDGAAVVAQPGFETQLAFGRVAEGLIAKWLMRRGYIVMPVYEIEKHSGKGPQVFTAEAGLVAPDMLAFCGPKARWVEAKHKSVFSWYRNGKYWVTGIDLRHYLDYLKLAELSPWPVYLLFLHKLGYTAEWPHECPTGLFGRELKRLSHVESHRSDRHGKSGMVYWNVSDLTKYAELSDVIQGVTPHDR